MMKYPTTRSTASTDDATAKTPSSSSYEVTQEAVVELEKKLRKLLTREVADVLAMSILRRAQDAAQASGGSSRLLDEVRTAVRLFVEPHKQPAVFAQLDDLLGTPINPAPERIAISDLADVPRARLRAREISRQLGSSAFAVQRASTAVSELARNIIMYAERGQIDIVARRDPALVMFVRAIDRGPGIPDVDAVLSGNFRSKTGLGKGLLAVKRISLRFSLQSNKGGTTVEAEIPL